jgi:uncharacterized protein DUF6265
MTRIATTTSALLALTFLLVFAFSTSSAQESQEAELSIDQLAFFAGYWSGDVFGGTGEEAWFAPKAGTMMGSFRHMKDGKTTFSEFFIIEETEQGIFFRFKHFNNDYTTWEDAKGTGPLEFKLVSVENNTAIFEGLTGRTQGTLRYMITDEGQLSIKIVRGIDEQGNEDGFELFFDRLN